MPTYVKPAIDLAAQVSLLRQRGMVVRSPSLARATLQMVNFYRFNGYALAFAVPGARPQQFQPGTRFEDVITRIEFDRALRMHVMNAVERIEVAVRSTITSEAALLYRDPHWFLDSSHFKNHLEHATFLGACAMVSARSDETFARHYRQRYTHPHLPPAWVIAELTSLGTWSMLYKNLADRALKLRVSQLFDLAPDRLEKNLHVLTYLRNLCAHHARVYNRAFTIKPSLNQGRLMIPVLVDTSFAAQAGVVHTMLRRVEPRYRWVSKLRNIVRGGSVPETELGFPPGWDANPFWKI